MGGDTRPLRADARRNRARVLEAAEVVLARDGLSAPMRAIAQEAGVGLGTIYRHFPTQEALFQAIIADRTRRLIAEVGALREKVDPGSAFFEFLTRIVDSAREKKALSDVVAAAGIDPKAGLADIQREMRDTIETLLADAQRSGAVRRDLRLPELLALLGAASIAAEQGRWSPELQAGALALLFDGFRPRP